MKVVINKCYGGFSLSYKGVMKYAELKGIELYPYIDEIHKEVYKEKATLDNPSVLVHYSTVPVKNKDELNKNYFSDRDIARTDGFLIKTIELLGDRVNNRCSKLEIVEIPDGVEWQIEEYDGIEWIAEKHRTWE